MPSVFKESDFERLTIRITDTEDLHNYVDIVIDDHGFEGGDGQVSYIRAGANGQQIGGYEGSTYHTMDWGTSVEHSFRALARASEFRENVTVSEHSLTVAIDHEEKKVLCGPMSYDSKDKLTVNDLDDPVHYKSNPWGGFTSDEVTVKIIASAFIKSTGKVVVKSFGDYDLSKDIEDTVAPQITLDYAEGENLPVATVGMDFPILPFSAKDALDMQVKTNVYVYYLDENGQRLINVSHNGKSFSAKYEGDYEIVYTAEDCSGNKAEKSIYISAGAKVPPILIAIEEDEINGKIYDTVSIKEAAEMQVFGGHGCLQVERAVYSPQGALLDVEDTLQLTELGDYKVVYKVTDYLQKVQYGVVTVHSDAVEKPAFIETPDFDKVLIKGFTYDLPQPFVVEVVDGKVVQVPCKVSVNGEAKDGSFTADGTSAEITYIAEGKTGTTEWTVTHSIVDTEGGKYQDRYFQAEGMTVTAEKDNILLSFAEDAQVEFIKELYARGFSFVFSYENETANFTSMSIVLTDAENRDLSVTFHFLYDVAENVWMMQLNGKGSKVVFAVSRNLFNFTYSDDGQSIVDSSGVAVSRIKEYDNGEPFNGFSGTLYFRMEFGGVSQESCIRLTNLCNQVMGYKKTDPEDAKDEIKPVIFLNGEFQVRQKLDEEARIPTAMAYDVLGQIQEFTVTVKNASGSVIWKDSATKPVKLLLSDAGNYTVIYYAKDSNKKSTELSYMMVVYDETAPTLTVTDSLAKEYKVGDKVSIPVYSATDNGANCYIQVTLILPNNEMRLLQYSENGEVTSLLTAENTLYNSSFKADENTFIVEQAGAYTLRFVAYDEYYNAVSYEMYFNVK